MARSPSPSFPYAQDRLRDEAISRKDRDCFASLAMTSKRHRMALTLKRHAARAPQVHGHPALAHRLDQSAEY